MNSPDLPASTDRSLPSDCEFIPELLNQLLQASLSGVVLLDASGHVVYANSAAEKILGRRWEDLANLRYDAVEWGLSKMDGRKIKPDELPFARVLSTGAPVRDSCLVIHTPDGAKRGLRINATPVRGRGKSHGYVVASVEDITRTYRWQSHENDMAKRLQDAQEGARFGLWRWDVEKDEAHWDRYAWWMFGYPPEKATTPFSYEDWTARLHPADLARVAPEVPRLLMEEADFAWDLRYRRADGGWHWVEQRGRVIRRDKKGQPLQATGTIVDIHKFKEAELLLEQIADSIEEAVWICTPEEMLYANRAYRNFWDNPEGPLEKSPRAFLDLIHPEDRPLVEAALEGEYQNPGTLDQVYRIIRSDQSVRWIRARSYLVDQTTQRTAGSAVDITELEEASRKLERMASTDFLTGIWNRPKFEETFNQTLHQVRTTKFKASLILMDIDHFKDINDHFGHQVGDGVLKEVAGHLQTEVRAEDKLARWGGEEFTILLPDTGIDDAVRLAERLRISLGRREFQSVEQVTASFGVTQLHPTDSGTHIGLRRADLALYQAKSKGRNRVAAIFR